MTLLELMPVHGKRRRPWELELHEHEVRLFDDRGDEVCTMPREAAVRRIQLPNFFMSIKHIHIYDDDNELLEFLPDKRALKRLQAYMDYALKEDPGARRQLSGSGWAVLVFGLLLLVGGAAFLTVEIARGTLLQPGRLRIASPFAGILMGAIFSVWGIIQVVRARRLQQREEA